MKVNFSQLTCPHCGATNFNLINQDVFLCEYCNQKFNFDLDEIDFSSENKIFIDELKEQFTQRINELHYKIIANRKELTYYSKLATKNRLFYFSIFTLLFSIALIFTSFLVALPCIVASSIFVFLSKKRKDKNIQKYHPKATYYASKIVNYQTEIDFYTRLISKLTK